MEIGINSYTFLILTSGVSWAIVYLLLIYRSFRDKTCGMPFWALAFNLAWEFNFSFVFTLRKEIQFVVRLWFIVDLFILLAYLLYGIKEWPQHISRKLFYPYTVVVFIFSYLFVFLISVEWNDERGMYAAFISNIMMSILFIAMLNKRKSLDGQSLGIAFFKMLGTLAPTILLGVESPFILLLGCSCFATDMIYLLMVYSFYKRLHIHPVSRRMLKQGRYRE